VRDDVVQLTRDSGLLARDRAARLLLALALEPHRLGLELAEIRAAGAEVVPE
jgi:cyanophycinase-like exopeptidase